MNPKTTTLRTRDGMFARVRRVVRGRVALGIAIVMLIAFAVIIVAGRQLAPMDPGAQHIGDRLLPPGTETATGYHMLGTDALGRDVWSLVLGGAQIIVVQSLLAVIIGSLVGTLLGLIAGYRGGRLGDALTLITNLQLSFPFFLLAIAVVGILGTSFWLVVFIVALASWVEITRVVYIEAREVAQLEYVTAVKVMRGSSLRIMFKHVLPNVAGSVLVLSGLGFGTAIVIISGLGFIGLSTPAESPGWGEVLSDGRNYMASAWWLTVAPGAAIFLLVFSINIVSEAIRDRLDPQLGF